MLWKKGNYKYYVKREIMMKNICRGFFHHNSKTYKTINKE